MFSHFTSCLSSCRLSGLRAPSLVLLCAATSALWGAELTDHAPPPSSVTAIDRRLGTPDPDTIDYPDAPPSKDVVELGRTLFFDNRLSGNQTQSCATCHNPDLGFGDGLALGLGSHNNRLGRNTPHLYNLAWNHIFFWDGRAATLEAQALGPIASKGEMDMDISQLLVRLQQVEAYKQRFATAYGSPGIDAERIGTAIAAFERTLVSRDAPFDRFAHGDAKAMSVQAQRGMALFVGKANCVACHSGPNFTDESFHHLGIKGEDRGRAAIQAGPMMEQAFKTPGLRNCLLTAPYMHDGSQASLEAVVRFYNRGGDAPTTDPLVKQLHLEELEIADLVAFLGALTDPIHVDRPAIP